MKFSRAVYGDSSAEPNFRYSLRPHKSDTVDSFEIAVNGETTTIEGGGQKDFVWPGAGATKSFKVTLKIGGKPVPLTDTCGALGCVPLL